MAGTTLDRRATSRRSGKSGVALRRAPRPAGILTSPRILHEKATRLQQVNAPNILSFTKKRAAARAGHIHGLKAVNQPGSRRSTAGSAPSIHGINAPKHSW